MTKEEVLVMLSVTSPKFILTSLVQLKYTVRQIDSSLLIIFLNVSVLLSVLADTPSNPEKIA